MFKKAKQYSRANRALKIESELLKAADEKIDNGDTKDAREILNAVDVLIKLYNII